MVVSGLAIETMIPADHDAVAAVGLAAWSASDAFEDSYLAPEVIERVRADFMSFPAIAGERIVVARRDGEVVGWGARAGAADYISDLWVRPDRQGLGIGGALLRRLCEIIAFEGFAKARLDTHAKNAGAIRLYERNGFTIVWRGLEYSQSMGVELQKVHLEKTLPSPAQP